MNAWEWEKAGLLSRRGQKPSRATSPSKDAQSPGSCTSFQLLGTEFLSIYPKGTEYNLEVTDLPLINTNWLKVIEIPNISRNEGPGAKFNKQKWR